MCQHVQLCVNNGLSHRISFRTFSEAGCEPAALFNDGFSLRTNAYYPGLGVASMLRRLRLWAEVDSEEGTLTLLPTEISRWSRSGSRCPHLPLEQPSDQSNRCLIHCNARSIVAQKSMQFQLEKAEGFLAHLVVAEANMLTMCESLQGPQQAPCQQQLAIAHLDHRLSGEAAA